MRATYGEFIAKASLCLAILAYFPSMAPFTPALGGAILAVPGALIGAFSGWYRCAILTLYFALATFPVSPGNLVRKSTSTIWLSVPPEITL